MEHASTTWLPPHYRHDFLLFRLSSAHAHSPLLFSLFYSHAARSRELLGSTALGYCVRVSRPLVRLLGRDYCALSSVLLGVIASSLSAPRRTAVFRAEKGPVLFPPGGLAERGLCASGYRWPRLACLLRGRRRNALFRCLWSAVGRL